MTTLPPPPLPLQFDSSFIWLTELNIIKMQIGTSQMKETYKVRLGSVPDVELTCPFPLESGYVILAVYQYVTSQEGYLNHGVLFLSKFH